jgi:hypothetical protein
MKKETVEIPDTQAGKIWTAIKDIDLEMFCLKKQYIHMFCKPLWIETNKLYLQFKPESVIAAIEDHIGDKYLVERNVKYIIISPLNLD